MKVGRQSSWFFQSFNRIKMTGENLQIYLYDKQMMLLESDARKLFGPKIKAGISNGVYLSFQTERAFQSPFLTRIR